MTESPCPRMQIVGPNYVSWGDDRRVDIYRHPTVSDQSALHIIAAGFARWEGLTAFSVHTVDLTEIVSVGPQQLVDWLGTPVKVFSEWMLFLPPSYIGYSGPESGLPESATIDPNLPEAYISPSGRGPLHTGAEIDRWLSEIPTVRPVPGFGDLRVDE